MKGGKIKSLEVIYLHALPVKEVEIIQHFLGKPERDAKTGLKEECLQLMPVQKMTKAGQRMRFKAYVAVGDSKGHLGLGTKCSREVANSITGATNDAIMNIIPIRMGFWGNKLGLPHTVPCKLTGRAGSSMIRLIPAPRGTGIVAAGTAKKLLQMAGVADCYTCVSGDTRTRGNFAKATFAAIIKTYTYLTPDLWADNVYVKTPFQEFTDFLARD